MATRSTIGITKEDGTIETVYCHFDGYPSNNGKLLLNHYQDVEKIQSLINLGDMSSLDESIECPEGHSYSSAAKGCSVFYGRDRGETGIEKRIFENLDNYKKGGGEEYNYLFANGKWLVEGEELTQSMIDAD